VHDNIDAGIIDVNLGGEFVYPVADVLAARNIPFVFITGYGVESIDSRFDYVPIVKKPVQRQVLQKIFVPAESGEPAKFPQRRYGAGRLGRAASAGQP
jgi:two-component SAPR family response regulator